MSVERVLEAGQYLVLQPTQDGRRLRPQEVLAPVIVSAGFGGELHGIVGATTSTVVWALRWPNGLSVAVALGLGETPDIATLFEAFADDPPHHSIRHIRPANELPC